MATEALPTGTLTFLFTDIEGSTLLVQEFGDGYIELIEAHDQLVRSAIESNRGIVVKVDGDSFFAVFADASDALEAIRQAQVDLAAHEWPESGEVRVRMGLHTGVGTLGGADYVGLDVHRAARISDAAHGGQAVLSETTAILVERSLPTGVSIRDLGKHRLKDLADPESIYQLVIAELPDEFPELRTLDAIPNNLPLQVTSFVGRSTELGEALRLLGENRILTLLGPGGTGKTRLSLQVAAEAADGYADGVFFVGLSPVSDTDVVPSTILASLGLQASTKDQSPRERLLDQIGGKTLLLLLDNFEHLLDAAPLVADMLRASPRSKFLVTSRAPLRISGEQEMPVPPLQIAERVESVEALMEVEAVKLFIERALAVRPDFELTDENASAVNRLVFRLDGLPLAIELVASRVRLFSVETILERLDSVMLSSGSVDLPERQRTIRGAIDWSYELLSEGEKRLFAELSVFSGGARIEQIETVCDMAGAPGEELFEALSVLVDHSLVQQSTSGPDSRFRMLHVIREFASEHLEMSDEAHDVHQRHLVGYTEFVEGVAPELMKKDRKQWLDALEIDHDNIRSAIEWAIDHDTDYALRLVAASWRFWQARSYLHEARQRADAAIALEGGELLHRTEAMEALGGILWWQGAMDDCLRVYKETLDLARELGDAKVLARALYNLSLPVAYHSTDPVRSNELLDEAEKIYSELGDAGGLGDIEWGRGGSSAYGAGDLVTAREHMLRSVDHYREAGNEFGLGWGLFQVGDLTRKMGDHAGGWPYLSEGLQLFAEQRDGPAVGIFLASMAGISIELGDETRAMRLAGAFHGLRISSGADLVVFEGMLPEGLEYDALQALTGELAEAFQEGLALDLDQATAYALAGPTDD